MPGWCRYASYYLTRNSLTYTAPVMVSDPSLKMDITQVRSIPDCHLQTIKSQALGECAMCCILPYGLMRSIAVC